MNARDAEELNKRFENPDFEKLYDELIRLQFQRGITSTAALPRAGALKNGESPKIMVISPPNEAQQKTIIKTEFLIKEARFLAHKLARFFPAERRYYWEEIFFTQVMGGSTTVNQAQRGGRHNELTGEDIDERLEILADVEKTKGEMGITFDQACARLSKKYNQCLIWSTVKKWRKYRNRPRNDS